MGFRRTWQAKYGTAVGVGVLGWAGFDKDPIGLAEFFSHRDRLQQWLADQGIPMSYDGEGLARVQARIDGWRADPLIGPQLDNEVGTYLGSVIVASVPGAVWTVWPNGHPVVTVAGGREIDVVAVASQPVASGVPSLTSVLESAGS